MRRLDLHLDVHVLRLSQKLRLQQKTSRLKAMIINSQNRRSEYCNVAKMPLPTTYLWKRLRLLGGVYAGDLCQVMQAGSGVLQLFQDDQRRCWKRGSLTNKCVLGTYVVGHNHNSRILFSGNEDILVTCMSLYCTEDACNLCYSSDSGRFVSEFKWR